MIGVGIVGYGYWGPNLARCAAETAGTEVVAIADASDKARERAARRHPIADMVADWRDLLRHPRVDAIMIATPVSSHFEIALAALRAGRHVLVEKPMAATAEQAERLIAEASRRKRVLMVDHTFVYTPAVRKIKELLVGGEIGRVYYYDSTRINLGLFQSDVNVVWDLAVHDLAILDYILDASPVAVSANAACHLGGTTENLAHVSLYFDDGVIAHLNVNWLAPVKIRRTLIAGSRRMIVYDDLEPSEKIKVYDRGVEFAATPEDIYRRLVSYRVGDMWAPNLSMKEALLTEMEEFADCIETGRAPQTSGFSGLGVVRTLEAASRSLAERGHPVELRTLRRAS